MKIIIIEGLDNTGKSTTINNIIKKFADKKIKVIHCEKPIDGTYEEQAEYQNQYFLNIVKNLINDKKNNEYDVVILDRAWYGEYVYGQLYRNHDPFDIEMNIATIEDSLHTYFNNDELSFILLNVNNIDFSIKKDDGLSISGADKAKIEIEQKMFETIFDYSTIINKKNIIVNNGMEFRSEQTIMSDVMSTIKK